MNYNNTIPPIFSIVHDHNYTPLQFNDEYILDDNISEMHLINPDFGVFHYENDSYEVTFAAVFS